MMNNSQGASSFFSGLSTLLGRPHPLLHNLSDTTITAIDLNEGEILWQIPNGDTPDYVREHPALEGIDIPPTGRTERGGTLVTRTLLFAGEGGGLFAAGQGSGGNKFRAYDKMTGEMVHEIELPANQTGNPMTYMLDGKQYIVMAIGARGHPAELVALTLP